MDRFQIVEVTEAFNHAGTKATEDISTVAERLGFKRLNVRMNTLKHTGLAKLQRQIGYYLDWKQCYDKITSGSVVLLQHPFHHKQLTRTKTLMQLKQKKDVRYISVVHDVEELRAFRYNDYYQAEFQTMLELADMLIVHNEVMEKWFVERGVPAGKLVSLEIFDYLRADKASEARTPVFENSVTIAGNLDTSKCGYIRQLGLIDGITFRLYGPNFDEDMRQYDNIKYGGSFPSNEIPEHLTEGFGLVWDGESIEGCKGLSGQYLRYNNPHKLSLYLSAGLPVIIWDSAAEAGFVKRNRVGICLRSLKELTDAFSIMRENDYKGICACVEQVRERLTRGYYAERAINEALNKLACGAR